MKSLRITPRARRDVEAICRYIARDNVDAAVRMHAELHSAFRKLRRMPGMGHKRADLTSRSVRFWPVRSYLVSYSDVEGQVRILRVLHAARDVRRVLREEE